MDIKLGPYKVGIDNVSDEGDLPIGAVRDAVNVDFDRDGGASRRRGAERFGSIVPTHSLWTSPVGTSYGVRDEQLCRLVFADNYLDFVPIHPGPFGLPLSYEFVNGRTVFGNESAGLYEILDGDVVRSLSLPMLGAPRASALTDGGLHPGRYGVAISVMRGDEEGPLSYASFVDVPEGGGIELDTPDGADALRVYRTEANGSEMYLAATMPPGGTFMLGVGAIGRLADNQYLAPMPGGQIVRLWRGHLLVARGSTLRWSEPMRFGVTDPRHNFIQLQGRITMMEPVEGGIFVGNSSGVVFLSGTGPKDFTVKRTSGQRPVPFTGLRMEASLLAVDAPGDTHVAAWLSGNGIVIGTSDGSLREVQSKRVRVPESQTDAGVGASVVHNRRLIATVQ